jgi:hypothetical protein
MSNHNQAPQIDPELEAAREQAFDTLTQLQTEGQTLDGPALTKAGLGYENRAKLGYTGSMDQMLEDASSWKSAKDESARAEAYHAENTAKAEAWNAETKQWREERAAADDRVEKVMYHAKINGGGEIGLKRNPGQADKNRETAQAVAEAEGHDVSHQKPRHYEVVTDPAAEARAAEVAALLKAQAPKASVAVENLTEQAQAARARADEIDAVEPLTRRATDVRDLPLDEQKALLQRIRTHEGVDSELEAELRKPLKDMDPELASAVRNEMSKARIAKEEAAAAQKAAAPAGVLARLKQRFGRGQQSAGSEQTTEKKYRGKRAVAGLAMGAVAVAGIAVAANHGDSDGPRKETATHATATPGSETTPTVELPDYDVVKGKTLELKEHDSVSLQGGENPWVVAQRSLHEGATAAEIDQVKDEILRLNHISEQQATSLPVGFDLKMPVELIEQINAHGNN